MNTPTDLPRQLALAACDLRAQTPPAPLLPAIHRQLRRGRWKQRAMRARRLSWLGWAGLSTATVALAAVLVVNSMGGDEPARTDTVVDADGFVRLVSADAWQRANAQQGNTWLVSAEVPRSRLAALGLPYDPARAGERVPAELLIHSSGEVLAVRVNRQEEKP
jgi:hypothetical protein